MGNWRPTEVSVLINSLFGTTMTLPAAAAGTLGWKGTKGGCYGEAIWNHGLPLILFDRHTYQNILKLFWASFTMTAMKIKEKIFYEREVRCKILSCVSNKVHFRGVCKIAVIVWTSSHVVVSFLSVCFSGCWRPIWALLSSTLCAQWGFLFDNIWCLLKARGGEAAGSGPGLPLSHGSSFVSTLSSDLHSRHTYPLFSATLHNLMFFIWRVYFKLYWYLDN